MTKMVLSFIATAVFSFGLGWLASSYWSPDAASGPGSDAFGPAVRDALREASPSIRTRRLSILFDEMGAEQVEDAVAVYDREVNFIALFEIDLLFEAWARHDPIAAFAHAEGWTVATKRQAAVEATIRSWATREPLAAREAVGEILAEYPTLRQPALTNLVVGWVHSGVPGVTSYVADLSEPYQLLGSIALVGAQTRRLNEVGLEEWSDEVLGEVGDATFKEGIFKKIAKALARRDPVAAIAWVERHDGEDYAADGYRLVAESGLAADPEAIIAWSGRADPEVRQAPIRFAARKWFNEDFPAATRYAEAAELTPLHDTFVAEYAGALFRKSEWLPSIDWAQKITDERLRAGTLRRASVFWLRSDPSAAEAWLALSPLDEADLEKVREIAARPVREKRGKSSPRGR
jgi:hypothetical protein